MNWLLPVSLAALQLAYWPRDPTPQPDQYVGVLAIVVITVALGWRRRRPLIALGVVVAGLSVGQLNSPTDGLLVLQATDMIGLYSVVVRSPRRVWLAALAALCVWQAAIGPALWNSTAQYLAESGLMILCYVVVAGGGVARRQWLAGRRAAIDSLHQAQVAHQEAGAGERRRLSAELHDVSAHHLTSIVVTMNAAGRLAKPDLVADSLRFAADTGRSARTELRRLLNDEATPTMAPLPDRLAELADAFARLGQRVRVEAPDLDVLAEPVAEHAYAIVREALTNTVRYAPGAVVRVRASLTTTDGDATALRLVIGNDAAPDDGTASRLGSGRGLGGLRRRTHLLGGALVAGPVDAGGWQVVATLPVAAPVPRRWSPGLFDVATTVLLLALPLGLMNIPDENPPLDARAWWWLGALVPLHTLPLLYRRRAPWAVWAAVYATALLWPFWMFSADTPLALTRVNVITYVACADLVAVYSVGAYARRRWRSLLVVPATAVVLEVVILFGTAAYQPGAATLLWYVRTAAIAVAGAAIAWALGSAARWRRNRVVGREDVAVTAAVAAAEAEAAAERARLVGGLREQVLRQTDRVVDAADRGDPDEVLAAARAALAAMRELLTALDPPVTTRPATALAASA